MDVDRLAWRTSSFSGGNGNGCVEVAPLLGGVGVRDTKDRSRAAHVYPSTTWELLLADVRANYPASK
jgi:hypothetical protein